MNSAELKVLKYFDKKFQTNCDSALNKTVVLKGKVVERVGDLVRIEVLHPDGSGTGERIDLSQWEVSLMQLENETHQPQGQTTRGD